MPLLLGIDLGTSSAKTVLLTDSGNVVGRGNASYPLDRPRPGWCEQSPDSWWASIAAAVKSACAAVGGEHGSVAAIGLSGQMHGTVLMSGHMTPMAAAVIWPDSRSSDQVREIEQILGRGGVIHLAGSPAATGFQAATVRWMQQYRPSLWDETHLVLLPKDYLRYRLVGEAHTDPSDASGTLFLDVRQRAWSRSMLEALNVDIAKLPPIADSTMIAGVLRKGAAADLGLKPGLPVVVGAADTAAGALGTGATSVDDLALTLSTGGQLLQPSQNPIVDAAGRIHTFCAASAATTDLPRWYHLGAVLSAGSALEWLRDSVLGLSGAAALDEMAACTAGTSPGAHGLLFLPYLAGERTPHMDPDASAALIGLTAEHGRPEIVRAVMEGVALACYDAYHVLRDLGTASRSILLAGGGARSATWRQVVADVFGLPLRHLVTPDHSAMGAAMLAGSAIGKVDIAYASKAWARYGLWTEPHPQAHAVYQELYPLFRDAYTSHRVVLQRLRTIGRRCRA